MTLSPNVPPLAVDNLREAEQALREAGFRLSTPRRLVLEALFEAAGPVAASDLARELSLDESSVYRNLEVLEHQGLIRHVHLGHSAGLYVRVGYEEVEYLYLRTVREGDECPPGAPRFGPQAHQGAVRVHGALRPLPDRRRVRGLHAPRGRGVIVITRPLH